MTTKKVENRKTRKIQPQVVEAEMEPIEEPAMEAIETEKEKPAELVLSIEAITLTAMKTIQDKRKTNRMGLDEVIASETLGQYKDDFWRKVSELPWDLILMETDPFEILYLSIPESQSKAPVLHFKLLAPVEYTVMAINEMITCLTVWHKHRKWVIDNYSWVVNNSEQMVDLLCRLRCVMEQLIQVNE